ncbi:recombinase family protein [Anaerotignum sp.]|uniref:recombinase family protein n=1 Tax=Anaerotignum sp. TaxID=2039241 RepID=UPI0027145F14|nr:recombinase family protein [Anaerotignum sp.]
MYLDDVTKMYKAGIYLRLSREDGDKLESNSIKNQRDFIEFYLKDKKDIVVVSVKIDDGYSGVTFERPALKELLEEIKIGTINCIIVKDLSRFGRNYIETGRYIEQIFPFLGVRFIAINDNIDTGRDATQTDSILIPFKNLMNDAYSRDISIKSRSQLKIRQKCGDFVGAFAVYGYSRSQEDKHKLVVDQEAAEIVKEIFAMRMAGYNNTYIAKSLNELGVPSPMEYKKLHDSPYDTPFKLNPRAKWVPMTVDRILKNEIYTGVMLQGKETSLSYKIKKRIKTPKEDWVRVEHTHEAIISKKNFEILQKIMLNDTRTSPENEKLYLLSGLLKCGGCGSNMVRKPVKAPGKTYAYYICSKNKEDKDACSSHRIRENFIEEMLLVLLKKHRSLFCEMDGEMKEIDRLTKKQEEKQKVELQLNRKKDELERYEGLKMSIYEDYREGVLTKDEYLEMKACYEKICGEIQKNIDALYLKGKFIGKNDCNNDRIRWFLGDESVSELNRTTLVLLIENIIIFDKKSVRVILQYTDEFEKEVQKSEIPVYREENSF